MELVLAILTGSFFGFALYRTGAANPRILLGMLRLKSFTLMKIILFAIGLASTLLALSAWIGILNLTHFHVKSMNLGVIVGGIIFGLGFGLGGTCPGTCVAATGTKGICKAFAAIGGGLMGVLLYSLTYGWWKQIGLLDTLNYGKITLFHISDKYGYLLPGSFTELLLIGVLFMAEAALPPTKSPHTPPPSKQ